MVGHDQLTRRSSSSATLDQQQTMPNKMKSPTSVDLDDLNSRSSCICDEDFLCKSCLSTEVIDDERNDASNIEQHLSPLDAEYSALSFLDENTNTSIQTIGDKSVPKQPISGLIHDNIGNLDEHTDQNELSYHRYDEQQADYVFIPPETRTVQACNNQNLQQHQYPSSLASPVQPFSAHSPLYTKCLRGIDTSSQEPSLTQNTDVLTQNQEQELTQLGDDIEENSSMFSPVPPSKYPADLRRIPWGRLVPSTSNQVRVDFLPRDPRPDSSTPILRQLDQKSGGVSLLGLDNIHPFHIFNEYTIGRSKSCDVTIYKQNTTSGISDKQQQRQDWAYGLISNRHCRIYCTLSSKMSFASVANRGIEIYIEDCSGNGTIVNNTVLRKGEKRFLHQGDEICLVNTEYINKKLQMSNTTLSEIVQQYSFIFMNCISRHNEMNSPIAQPRPTNTGLLGALSSACTTGKRKTGAVDVRSTKHPRLIPPCYGILQQSQINFNPFNATNAIPSSIFDSQRSQSLRRIQEDYDIRDLLGSGTVGNVHRAIHRKTGQQRAVKIIQLSPQRSNFVAINSNNYNNAQQFQTEAKILQALGEHPYIVKLVDVYVSTNVAVYLVMELVEGGDLFDRIVEKGRYSETESRRVMRRLLSAIHYLHEERNIVHRDLKPENILCTTYKNDIDIKITDFGLAKAVNGNEDGLKTFCGTPQYFAPEVMKRRNSVWGRGRYGKQADMWSLGVILYVLLSGTPPFKAGVDSVAYGKEIEFPDEFWKGVSQDAKDLILKLLVKEPSRRYTVKDACNHKWITTSDGDTHVHPLDDPQLPTLTKIQSPATLTTTTSRQQSLKENSFPKAAEVGNGIQDTLTSEHINAEPVSPDQIEESKEVDVGQLPSSEESMSENEPCLKQHNGWMHVSDRRPLSPILVNNGYLINQEVSSNCRMKHSLNDGDDCNLQQSQMLPILNPVSGSTGVLHPIGHTTRSHEVREPKIQTDSKMDLSDDEIISQFSAQTESITSFTSEGPTTNNVDSSFTAATRLFEKISPIDVVPCSGKRQVGRPKRQLPAENTGTECSNNKPRVKKTRKSKKNAEADTLQPKHVNSSLGSSRDCSRGCGGKQTTLSGWFTKPAQNN